MLLSAKEVSFKVSENAVTSGILMTPTANRSRTAIVIAHGAGNDMGAPLLAGFSEGLSRSGYPTLRFNFLYRQQGRQAPDRQEVLAETWLAAYRFLDENSGLEIERVVGAGKSMGGRIAAQIVAEGLLPVERLIFLGYPLHPPGRPERMRDESLYRIRVPMLFFSGTRDPLCNLDRLKGVLGRLHTDWELSIVEEGDHSFHVPRTMGRDQMDVTRRIVEKTIDWLHG
jgi:uncharacterized protein